MGAQVLWIRLPGLHQRHRVQPDRHHADDPLGQGRDDPADDGVDRGGGAGGGPGGERPQLAGGLSPANVAPVLNVIVPTWAPVTRRCWAGGGMRVATVATDSSSSVCHSQPSAPLTAEPSRDPDALNAAASVPPTQASPATSRAVGDTLCRVSTVMITPAVASSAIRIGQRAAMSARLAICRAAAR